MPSRFTTFYRKIFSISEIEENKILQYLFYIISASFFVTFYNWIGRSDISLRAAADGMNVCPPYFQSCSKLYFLQDLPYGYTQNYFYVFLYILLLWGIYVALSKNWVRAHQLLLTLFSWKVIWIFFLTYGMGGNYDYYDMVLTFCFLFLQNKLYFAKLSFVWMYFLASTIKVHEGWIFGNYLNSLYTGAPLFPEKWLPWFSNVVILMQMIGAWFLLSKRKVLQQLAFFYFLTFHIYSGFIVSYRYITVSIPALVVLFSNWNLFKDEEFKIKNISKNTFLGYLFLVFLFVGQTVAIAIPGDQKKTLEGNYYGLYMFEANHQCISMANVFKDSGEVQPINRQNIIANNRCDPYRYWFELKNICEKDGVSHITWTFDHSINGNQFERIVETSDACTLSYKAFSHNTWIKLDGESTKLPITVFKNPYAENIAIDFMKTPSQPIVNPNLLTKLKMLYTILWVAVFLVVMIIFIKKQFQK
jgi:hypothetical protein